MSAITETYTFSGAGEDFGPKKGSGLIVLHTFENTDPLKNTMRDARAGAIWQDRHDVLGAYNRIIAVDGVLGCVPDDHISGGMAAGDDVYRPLAWLYAEQPAHKINDGNSYSQQLCAMGRRAYYDANGWPAGIIDGFARSVIDEEQRTGLTLGAGLTLANHFDFQPGNRSDAGGAKPLVLARIAQLKGIPQEDDLQLLPNYQTLMTGRLRETAGVVRTPLYDGELITVLQAGTWVGIVHRMLDQGGYIIDGVPGNDWLAIAIGNEVGYVEEPLVVDRHLSDAGKIVVPPAPAPAPADCSVQEAALAAAIESLAAERARIAAARIQAQETVDALAA